MVNYSPSFATDLNLLLLDNNTLSLVYLSSLLKQYAFKVTTTDEVAMAMSMISNHESQFRLVMIKQSKPSIHDIAFLDLLHEKDIPVVFISSGGFEDAIWKTLSKGSCYFLEEPILYEDLKNLWQLAYQSKPKSAKDAQYANQACGEKEERKIDNDGNESKEGEKRAEQSPKKTGKRREHKIGFAKKRHILWTPELHLKFTEALALLGGHESKTARPKAIQRLMKVPDLTLNQIASHMQKYKRQLKRNKVTSGYASCQASTSSNIYGKTMFPSMLGSPSYQVEQEEHMHESINQSTAEFAAGIPASFAPLNASPKQELNYAGTSDIHKVQSVLSNSSVANEFPTALVSQIDGATVGNSLPDVSSTLQNLPETEYEDIFRMLEEDIDTNNFGNFDSFWKFP